jgi:conjugative relaxase-like TrwC/TraI family protein
LAVVVTIAKGYDLGYIWKTQDHATYRAIGGYYIDAAQAGEPPGRWWGPGAHALGLTPGQAVQRAPYDAVYRQIDPRTGAKLGRPRGRYPTFTDHLARLKAAEPHATAERLIALEREAAQATRQPAAYYDVTISFSKSISVLHASIRENERRARLGGDRQAAAYWGGREQAFQEALHRANRAALEYLQAWAGITRTGYHGVRVDGREPGRFEPAGLIVTSWLQGTSRDGDPQDHIHNQIARITRTFRDGKWRALDTMSVRAVLGALQAVAATTVECELTREFGVDWIPRADGRGNEIRGISQAQMDAYSTRSVQVREKERELARAWERKHGRAPTSRELLHLANAATLQSRKGKDAGAIDWDALARRWDATLGGDLAGIAPAVSDARGPGAQAGEHHAGWAPSGPPAPEAQARALAKALALVSEKHPAWTRHDLLKQLALVLPPETRRMSPEEAQELLLGLAEEALSAGPARWCAWKHRNGRRCPPHCAASWTAAASIRVLASRGTPPPRSYRWKSGWSRTRRRKPRRVYPASWPRGVSAPISRSYARPWPAARRTRASTPRGAGCAWTRPRPRGTRSPPPAPWK